MTLLIALCCYANQSIFLLNLLNFSVLSYMLTRNKEQKCEELKKYKDEKLNQQDGSLKEMCSEIKKQLDEQNDNLLRIK